jgi:hypothetical protein
LGKIMQWYAAVACGVPEMPENVGSLSVNVQSGAECVT